MKQSPFGEASHSIIVEADFTYSDYLLLFGKFTQVGYCFIGDRVCFMRMDAEAESPV